MTNTDVRSTSISYEPELDVTLIGKAVEALLKHHKSRMDESKSLLGSDVTFHVVFSLEVPSDRSKHKPIQIKIPHSASVDSDDPEVCLIVKEDAKPGIQELIAKFPKELGFVKKVLGLQSLRNKHAEYAQRRALLHRFTHFMADDRILPMLTKALGKDFLVAKKQPIPICVSKIQGLPKAIHNALCATYLFIPDGTCVDVKVGHTGMSPNKLLENILAVARNVPTKIPRKWANIRSINIKLPKSQSLPFYNKTPTELQEIANMAGIKSVWLTEQEVAAEEAKRIAAKEAKEAKKLKRKLNGKSPLVKAIKKQKKLEEGNNEKESNETVELNSGSEKQQSSKLSKKKRKLESKSTDSNKEDNGEEVNGSIDIKKNVEGNETKKKQKAQKSKENAIDKSSSSDDIVESKPDQTPKLATTEIKTDDKGSNKKGKVDNTLNSKKNKNHASKPETNEATVSKSPVNEREGKDGKKPIDPKNGKNVHKETKGTKPSDDAVTKSDSTESPNKSIAAKSKKSAEKVTPISKNQPKSAEAKEKANSKQDTELNEVAANAKSSNKKDKQKQSNTEHNNSITKPNAATPTPDKNNGITNVSSKTKDNSSKKGKNEKGRRESTDPSIEESVLNTPSAVGKLNNDGEKSSSKSVEKSAKKGKKEKQQKEDTNESATSAKKDIPPTPKNTPKSDNKKDQPLIDDAKQTPKSGKVTENPTKENAKDTKSKDKTTPKAQSEKNEKSRQAKSEDDTEGSPAKKQKKDTPVKSKDESYIPAKAYTGSKKGFVFKKGPKGLGYYVDVPPVVDKMALAALARLQTGSSNKHKSGRKSTGSSFKSGGGANNKRRKSR